MKPEDNQLQNERRGSICFEPRDFKYIPILRCLYELESTRISGPASYTRKLTDCTWTKDELKRYVQRSLLDESLVDPLLEKMTAERQILVLPSDEDGPAHHLSRLGETIRLLGHTYEYWHRGWPAIKAIRWVIEDKIVPKRTVPAREILRRISEIKAMSASGPPLQADRDA